jgi:hypothetical protein
MTGPAPKHPSARARRNKTSTNATLAADASIVAPELPAYDWHEMTLSWWRDLWASPMAPEYDDSDRHGLFKLAMLQNDFWTAETAKERKEASAEIRLQEQRFGLSPIDRRRLQWEIEKSEAAVEQGTKRRTTTKANATESKGDPRAVLRAV